MAKAPLKKKQTSKLQKSYSFKLWQIVLFVLVFAAIGVYGIMQSSAAPRGGKGGGKYPATVQLTLIPVENSQYGAGYSHISVTGCGYMPNAYVTYVNYQSATTSDGSTTFISPVDSNGCLAYVEPYHTQHKFAPGTYVVEVSQRAESDSKSSKVMAKSTFVVQ
jgi:hypothetical protein